MSELRTIIVSLDPVTADALDALAATAGMTVGSFVGDQLQFAFSHSVLSRRELGRNKRRMSRSKRRTIAIANRANRQAAKASSSPHTQPETNLDV